MAFKQEINVPLVVTIGAVSGFVLIVLVIGVQAWYLSEEQAEMDAKADSNPVASLLNLKDDQKAHLADYHWADAKQQAIMIPIDRAMQIMVDTNGHPPTTQPTTGKSDAAAPATPGAGSTK